MTNCLWPAYTQNHSAHLSAAIATEPAQVQAEAARTGVLAQNGEIPAQVAVQTAGKSRDEVKAELATAQRAGTVLNYHGA